jgi:hypothetical protein
MPKFDGTGPMGMGPQAGWGYGPCGLGLGWRRRFGANRGMGRYFGNWDCPETKEERLKALVDYKKALEEELEDVAKEEGLLQKQG